MARSGAAWSVKGIDAETRAVARTRASDAALTIGAWIDQAILAHAGAPPRPNSDQQAPSANTNVAQNLPDPDPESARTRSSSALGGQDLLDIISQELEASRDRVDRSLRPVGFALKDLALRLVASEALQRGDRGEGGARAASLPRITDSPDPETRVEPTTIGIPSPPLGSLAPPIDPTQIATPPDGRGAPRPPVGDLSARITGVEPAPSLVGPSSDTSEPVPATFSTPIPREGRPLPLPPTGALVTVDPGQMPVPPTPNWTDPPPSPTVPDQQAQPTEIKDFEPAADASPPTTQDAQDVRFTGVQEGFESDPDLAVVEARADSGRKTIRALKIAAALAPFLIIGSLAAGYFLAEPLGMAPLRDEVSKRVFQHADATRRTLADAYHATIGQFDRLTANQEPTSVEAARKVPEPRQRTASAATDDRQAPAAPASRPDKERRTTKPIAVRPSASTAPTSPRPGSTASPGMAPDDPPVANLGGVRKPATDKPVVVARPAPEPPRLAAAPPARPVLPKITRPAVEKPKAPTKLAALPQAPPIEENTIPSSKLNGAALIAALRDGARAGDPRAQHELGRRLIQGDGVEQDFASGSEWFREAAIQGVSNAQYNLAVLYERGLGVTKDDVRALLWYHSAAEQSHPLAQYNLGIFYLQGRGIPLSYAEAVRWFRAASNQGVARATYNLAVLTEDGLGVPPNKKKAMTLYEKAASLGHHEAASRLALLVDPNSGDTKPATFEETAGTQAEGASTGTTVADIQAFLRRGGIYNGRIDGIAGPKTRTAIREYQRRKALPITGIPSEILLDFMKTTRGSNPAAASASG